VLAKMASDFKKPNLVHTLYSYEIEEKMWPLPVEELFMCGHSSVESLRKLEILTIGDLAKANPKILYSHLKSHGKMLWEFANGVDDSKVETLREKAKGVGNSTTVSQDIEDAQEAHKVLMSLAESVGNRLRKGNQLAGSVSCEIKYNTFVSVSHQTTLVTPTDSTTLIYETARNLFNELWNGTPIRLLGIRTSKLCDVTEPVQLSLFDIMPNTSPTAVPAKADLQQRKQKQEKLDKALDTIKNKYGKDSIVRGSLLNTTGFRSKKHDH
ncbi:MAG: DNA polymerase IV, partial [Lachnospiraceae bacterium]|nr:DNA polymerase IV [Lachnospiraceae bacterium]